MATVDFYGPYYISGFAQGGPLQPGQSWELYWLLDRTAWLDQTHTVSAWSLGDLQSPARQSTEVTVRSVSLVTNLGVADGRRNEFMLHAIFTNLGPDPIWFLSVHLSFVGA